MGQERIGDPEQGVNTFWLVKSAVEPNGLRVHGLDAAALAGVGGVWAAVYVRQLMRRSLLPGHAETSAE